MRILEGAIFLSIAAGLHMGVWIANPGSNGAKPSGDAGQSSMTIAAATRGMAQLTREWQTPPELLTDVRPSTSPHSILSAAPPVTPAPELTPPTRVVPDRPSLPETAGPPATEETAPTAPVAPPSTALLQPPPPSTVPRPEPQPKAHARPASPALPKLAQPETATLPKADTRPSTPQPKARARGKPQNDPASDASQSEQVAAATQSAQTSALQAQWGARIQRKVHRNLFYPRGANGSGTARVALTVDRTGRLQSLQLIRSSGVAAFDEAALRAVQRAGRFPRAPSELSQPSYRFTMGLNFKP